MALSVDTTAVVSLLLDDGTWHVLSGDGGGITVSEGIEFERGGETVAVDGLWLHWVENTPNGQRRMFAPAASVLGIGTD